jgi:hypothetical protein
LNPAAASMKGSTNIMITMHFFIFALHGGRT